MFVMLNQTALHHKLLVALGTAPKSGYGILIPLAMASLLNHFCFQSFKSVMSNRKKAGGGSQMQFFNKFVCKPKAG